MLRDPGGVELTTSGLASHLKAMAYGVSRQTLLRRVKRGELQAAYVRTGHRKGLRIRLCRLRGIGGHGDCHLSLANVTW
jgi:hypothetical protein